MSLPLRLPSISLPVSHTFTHTYTRPHTLLKYQLLTHLALFRRLCLSSWSVCPWGRADRLTHRVNKVSMRRYCKERNLPDCSCLNHCTQFRGYEKSHITLIQNENSHYGFICFLFFLPRLLQADPCDWPKAGNFTSAVFFNYYFICKCMLRKQTELIWNAKLENLNW